MSNKYMIMVVTKKPNKPATVNDDVFEGTKEECIENLVDSSGILMDSRPWRHEIFTKTTTILYAASDDWVKLLVVPTTDIEIK